MDANFKTSVVGGVITGAVGKLLSRNDLGVVYMLPVFIPVMIFLVFGFPHIRAHRNFIREQGARGQLKREYLLDYCFPVWKRMLIWFVAAIVGSILIQIFLPRLGNPSYGL